MLERFIMKILEAKPNKKPLSFTETCKCEPIINTSFIHDDHVSHIELLKMVLKIFNKENIDIKNKRFLVSIAEDISPSDYLSNVEYMITFDENGKIQKVDINTNYFKNIDINLLEDL